MTHEVGEGVTFWLSGTDKGANTMSVLSKPEYKKAYYDTRDQRSCQLINSNNDHSATKMKRATSEKHGLPSSISSGAPTTKRVPVS